MIHIHNGETNENITIGNPDPKISLEERVKFTLEVFDSCIIKIGSNDTETENQIHVETIVTPAQFKRHLHIIYGSKVKKMKGGYEISK